MYPSHHLHLDLIQVKQNSNKRIRLDNVQKAHDEMQSVMTTAEQDTRIGLTNRSSNIQNKLQHMSQIVEFKKQMHAQISSTATELEKALDDRCAMVKSASKVHKTRQELLQTQIQEYVTLEKTIQAIVDRQSAKIRQKMQEHSKKSTGVQSLKKSLASMLNL